MKKMFNYFIHPSNMAKLDDVLRMRMTEGSSGYGIYIQVLELLRDCNEYKTKYDPAVIAWGIHENEIDRLKRVCEEYNLFELSADGFLSSTWLKNMMSEHDEKREKFSKAGRASAEARAKSTKHANTDYKELANDVATTLNGGGQHRSSNVNELTQENKPNNNKTKENNTNKQRTTVLDCDDVWSDEVISFVGKEKGDIFIVQDENLKQRCDSEHNVLPIAAVARDYKMTCLQYSFLERACAYGRIGSPELMAFIRVMNKAKESNFKPLYAFEYFMKSIRKEIGK